MGKNIDARKERKGGTWLEAYLNNFAILMHRLDHIASHQKLQMSRCSFVEANKI